MKRTLYYYHRRFNGGKREGFLVRLQSGGKEGWGEIAPLPGFSRESLDEAFHDFQTETYSLPSVQFGYSTALWDLTDLISVPSIPIKKKVKAGHLSLKKALQNIPQVDSMRIDFNRKWSLEDALLFAKHYDVEYFEEPLMQKEDAAQFPYPVALDESLREKNMPHYPNVVAHVIKPTMQGLPIATSQKGIDFILSSSYETELGIHQIAKLAHRLALPLKPMGLATCHLFEEPLFEEEPYIEESILHFPDQWRLIKHKVQVALDE